MYRAARAAGALRDSGGRPESFEMDQATQILASLFYLIQEQIKTSPRVKKYKPRQWPRPLTAAELVRREDADQGYEALMAEIVYLPQDEFEAHIAEHRARQAAIRHDPEPE